MSALEAKAKLQTFHLSMLQQGFQKNWEVKIKVFLWKLPSNLSGNKLGGDLGEVGTNFSLFSAEGEVKMYRIDRQI